MNNFLTALKDSKVSHAYCLVGDSQICQQSFNQMTNILGVDKNEIWQLDIKKVLVEDVRKLINWVNQKPLNGQYKMVYLNLMDIQNVALNALLKIIEEPPEYAIIVISVDNIRNVLPTIKSRCRVVWLGSENIQLTTSKRELDFEDNMDLFLKIPDIIENNSAGEVIDHWLDGLQNEIRAGNKINQADELLELKKYTKTNMNSRLLLEYAFLSQIKADK